MTGAALVKNCWGCVHRSSRLRGSTPRSWCGKYHTVTSTRCADYTYKPKAVETVLRYLRRTSLK